MLISNLFENAFDALEEIENIAEKKRERVNILIFKANYFTNSQNYQEATALYMNALEITGELMDFNMIANIKSNLVNIYLKIDDFDGALATIKASLNILSRNKDSFSEIEKDNVYLNNHLNWAYCYKRMILQNPDSKLIDSLKFHSDVVARYIEEKEIKNSNFEMLNNTHQGRYYFIKKNYKKAIRNIRISDLQKEGLVRPPGPRISEAKEAPWIVGCEPEHLKLGIGHVGAPVLDGH